MPVGTATNWTRPFFDGLRSSDLSSLGNPVFGAAQFQGLHLRNDNFLPKIQVAADYSDSVPDSSKYFGNPGYHPLEELKDYEVPKNKMPTDAEIARTAVEANNIALLVFPGAVHCEPHTHPSWADFQYVIDDYGDIFVEIFDGENILLDRAASSPVTVLIGMDELQYEEHIRTATYGYSHGGESNHDSFRDRDHSEVNGTSDIVNWSMRDTLHQIHPIFFSKCLIKATRIKHVKKLDHPTNGVSITGCLRPAFEDEVSYIRRFFHGEDSDGYLSDWRDGPVKEDENMAIVYDLTENRERTGSILYKLEIVTMDLFSLYGTESTINLQDFQDAEVDILVHCAPNIIERFNEHEMKCEIALKALCRKKKGLNVERAYMVGIDSLGVDVRVFFGLEVKTVRFSFNARYRKTFLVTAPAKNAGVVNLSYNCQPLDSHKAYLTVDGIGSNSTMSESAAEKKIRRMLFPRKYRKNLQSRSDSHKDLDSF